MIHVDHVNDADGLVDPISNSILAATRPPLALEGWPKWRPDPMWLLR
jgi:hypothetical protein